MLYRELENQSLVLVTELGKFCRDRIEPVIFRGLDAYIQMKDEVICMQKLLTSELYMQ